MQRMMLGIAVALGLGAEAAAADTWNRLVAPAELAALVQTGGVTVLDIRAPEDYAAGHIAGALNAPYGTWRGPQNNPGLELTDARLTERLQSLGIEPGDKVVVTYEGKDSTDFGAAARVYWTLKSAGLTEIAILNGGIGAWTAAGQPLSLEPATAARSAATFALADTWRIDRAGVEAVIEGKRRATLVDARPVEFYQGLKKHPAASRPGTAPGALSLPEGVWFTGSPTEISAGERVLAIARDAGYSAAGTDELVSFCNTGHWAATNWFALSELAGIEDVRLYPESMVGWSNAGGALVNGPTQ